ncbi:PREDICTED: C-C motif chemokine 15 isoform X2 [Chinchilla lanigera]|uniref:C-C motif chemokine 15 isoform X2 n=1 Tax=Chinchilla lanigera TaxID=34839 RepID=UPI0006987EC7|nr:PREDICTED: C-C motif chemokine 15 isoform X2 [Chinchilla lanigera]
MNPGVSGQICLPTTRMKVSTAALSFFVLAAALGSQAQTIYDTEIRKLQKTEVLHKPLIFHKAHANAPDCCFSYISRNIRCKLMEDYFETSALSPRRGNRSVLTLEICQFRTA